MTVWVCLLALFAVVGEAAERTIIYFSSAACPACRQIQPAMEQLQAEGRSIRFIDAEQDRFAAERFGIQQLPTLIVLESGREVDRIVGSRPDAELRQRLVGRDRPSSPSKPRPSSRERAAAPNPNSLIGPNHPLSRSRASAGYDQRNRIDESAGDVQRSRIGINHPFYSLYQHPHPQPAPDRVEAGGLLNRPSLSPHLPSVSTHPLLKGANPLPASPESMAATVRIQVDYGDNKSVGTGTIIHTFADEALVLTCGHLFREQDDRAPVTVELFQQGKIFKLPASVVDVRHAGLDLALIRFRAETPLNKVPILSKGQTLHERDPVYSIGCDLGADPSRRDTVITRLNRYLGTSNVEIAGAPIQGRSGGGLFDARGRLVGVCYAADDDLDEGLFVGPEAIYEQLKKFRLSRLYEPAQPSISQERNSFNAEPKQAINPSSIGQSRKSRHKTEDPEE